MRLALPLPSPNSKMSIKHEGRQIQSYRDTHNPLTTVQGKQLTKAESDIFKKFKVAIKKRKAKFISSKN